MTSTTSQDTDPKGFAAVPDADTIHDLESSIAPMLLDADLRERTLRRLAPAERLLATRALERVARLHNSTEWTDEELLARLGCTLTRHELQDDGLLPKLERCEHFLSLVERLVGFVDTTRDRRAVVLECAKLLRTTGTDSHGLEEAFERGSFPAVEYLKLGEISAASDVVRVNLGVERRIPNPYASAPTVHLSASRLGMFLDGYRDLIGDANVFDRIESHIAGCAPCRAALDRRRRAVQQVG